MQNKDSLFRQKLKLYLKKNLSPDYLESSFCLCASGVRGRFGQSLYKQFGASCISLSSFCDFPLTLPVAVIVLNSAVWFLRSKNSGFISAHAQLR